MIKIIPAVALSLTLCFGCNNNDKAAKADEKKETTNEAADSKKTNSNDDDETSSKETGTKAQLLSGVDIAETGGLKVTRAFVSSVDGNVFSKEVTAGADEKVILNLNLDGFKVEDGKSFIGAAEKITAADGTVILNAEDLFSKYTVSGINADDAKMVRLSAVVTGNVNSSPYYIVSFRVWDKKGDGEAAGSYRILPK